MIKIFASIALILGMSSGAYAGTYTINTDATTDTDLQVWCFAYNATQSPALFVQPGSSSGITVANGKACMIALVTASMAALSIQAGAKALTPTVPTQMN